MSTHGNENIVRNTSNNIRACLKKWNISDTSFGVYYTLVHCILMTLGAFVILFSNNVIYLTMLLIVISLDAFANIVLHNCPLTMLEQKYLGTNIVSKRKSEFKKAKIVYKCNHIYEPQIELLINIWSFVAAKIFFLIAIRCVNLNIISTTS